MFTRKIMDLVEESVRINRECNEGSFFIVAKFFNAPTVRKRVGSFDDVLRTLQTLVDYSDSVLMSFSFERTK